MFNNPFDDSFAYYYPEVRTDVISEIENLDPEIERYILNNCVAQTGQKTLRVTNLQPIIDQLLIFRGIFYYYKASDKINFITKCLDALQNLIPNERHYTENPRYRASLIQGPVGHFESFLYMANKLAEDEDRDKMRLELIEKQNLIDAENANKKRRVLDELARLEMFPERIEFEFGDPMYDRLAKKLAKRKNKELAETKKQKVTTAKKQQKETTFTQEPQNEKKNAQRQETNLAKTTNDNKQEFFENNTTKSKRDISKATVIEEKKQNIAATDSIASKSTTGPQKLNNSADNTIITNGTTPSEQTQQGNTTPSVKNSESAESFTKRLERIIAEARQKNIAKTLEYANSNIKKQDSTTT